MIKKEYLKTRDDGVELYRTYSDTEHKIRKVKDNVVYSDAIDVNEGEEYEEVEEYIELEGAETYEEVLETLEISKNLTRKINMIGLTNNEALSVKEVYPAWESKIDKTIEVGYIVLYNGNLWRARQTHTALSIYHPSINTSSLYEVIVWEYEGTIEDPIPYTPPMEIFKDKYYTQYDVLYLCIRDSDTAITHDLFDVRNIYVELIEK